MARTVGKDAPVKIESPTPPKHPATTYSKPSQKAVKVVTGAPASSSKTGSAPRFMGGAKINTPSPSKK